MPGELPLILVFSVKKVSQAAVLENHQVFGLKSHILFRENAFDTQLVEVVAVNKPYLVKYITLKSELKS